MLQYLLTLRIRVQLALVVTVLIALGSWGFYRYASRLQKEMFARGFSQAISATFENVRIGVEVAFTENNFDVLQNIIDHTKQDSTVHFIVLTDTANATVAAYPEQPPMPLAAMQFFASKPSFKDSVIVRSGAWNAARASDTLRGRLYIGFSTLDLRRREEITLREIGVTTALAVLAGLGITYLVAFGITRPLERLQLVALQIAAGNSSLRADDHNGGQDTRSLASAFNLMLGKLLESQRHIEQQRLLLEREQHKNEELLRNILPSSIATRLKNGETMIADSYDEVTVVFADIVGFTELASQLTPVELIDTLNRVFSLLDEFSELYSVEKIKTIGDAYMIVSGAPDHNPRHAEAAARMALEIVEAVHLLSKTLAVEIEVRVGMHLGPVVAGVIGTKKFAYDLWGDTVNTASRMESHGEVGKIQCSEAVYERLKDMFVFEHRGALEIKGKGRMNTYFLTGRKS